MMSILNTIIEKLKISNITKIILEMKNLFMKMVSKLGREKGINKEINNYLNTKVNNPASEVI